MSKFIDIIKVLFRKWKLWTIFPILAVALVFYLTKNLPKVYVSQATIHVNLQTNSDLSLSGQAIKPYEIAVYFQNLLQLLKSRSTLEYVRLRALRDFVQGKHQLLVLDVEENNTFEYDSVALLKLIDRCIENQTLLSLNDPEQAKVKQFLEANGLSDKGLNGMVKGARLGNSYFLRITTETNGAFKSKYFADLFSEALIRYHINLSRESISKDREIMEELVRQAKLKLDEKVQALEDFKIKNTIINLGELTKAIVNQTVDMEIALAKLEESEAAKRQGMLEVERIFQQKGAPLPLNLESNAKIVELKSELREVHRAEIKNAFQEQKPLPIDSLAVLTAQVKQDIHQNIKKSILDVPYDPSMTRQDLVGRYIGLQLDAEMAREMVPIVRAEIQRLKVYANSFAPLESAIGTFDREIHTAEQSYLILLNKLNLTKTVEQGTGVNELTINDEAFLPIKPKPSKRAFMLAGAGMAVFILIAAFIVVVELLDRSISTISQFEAITHIPMVSAFPNANDARIEPNSKLANSISLLVREQVKSLREKVIAVEENKRTFLFTSTYEAEGKTWVAQSLAQKLAANNYKVLLIQADWFGKSPIENGLQILGNQFEDLKTIEASGVLQLNQKSESPFDWATQAKWLQTLTNLKSRYDFIFVIAPPLSICSDWKEWATLLDQNFHLFRANKTFRVVDQRAEKSLLASDLNNLGSIFNKVNIEQMEGFIGDVPKKRSKLRKLVKKWAYGGFKG